MRACGNPDVPLPQSGLNKRGGMEIKVRKIVLGFLAAAVLLGVCSRSLKGDDPAGDTSVVTSPSDDNSNPAATDPAAPDQGPVAQTDPASSVGSGIITPLVNPSVAPVGNPATAAKKKGFGARFAQGFYDDGHPPASASTDMPKYRGDPMPE